MFAFISVGIDYSNATLRGIVLYKQLNMQIGFETPKNAAKKNSASNNCYSTLSLKLLSL